MIGLREESAVAARELAKWYGRDEGLVRAIDGVDLEVAVGETVAVMGPSGCGKSTLLHVLGGLDRPSGGEVWLAGRRIDGMSERDLARMRRTKVGFVFQAFHLMEELTAAENVELPALLAGRSPRVARRRGGDLLERVGLADRAGHLPFALSGGQRQRVAIARAFVNEPLVCWRTSPLGISTPPPRWMCWPLLIHLSAVDPHRAGHQVRAESAHGLAENRASEIAHLVDRNKPLGLRV